MLSQPRAIFGIHSFTAFDVNTRLPYGKMLEVLGGSSFTLSGDTIDLRGGSFQYPFEVKQGNIEAEISLNVKEYPDWLWEVFLGKAPTANSSEANGNVSTPANVKGTSIIDAVNGISTVIATSGDEADLKFGRYVIVATGAATVNLYTYSNIDFARGTDTNFQDDTLKLLAADVTISSGANLIADYGLTLTGVGTPAFSTDDTAEFEVRPINSASMTVEIGATIDQPKVFGSVFLAQKCNNGQMFETTCWKCLGIGLPFGLQEKAFSESEITAKVFYDAERGSIARFRYVEPS